MAHRGDDGVCGGGDGGTWQGRQSALELWEVRPVDGGEGGQAPLPTCDPVLSPAFSR